MAQVLNAQVTFTPGTAIPLSMLFAPVRCSRIYIEPDVANASVSYLGDSAMATGVSTVDHVVKVFETMATIAAGPVDKWQIHAHNHDALELAGFTIDGAASAAGTITVSNMHAGGAGTGYALGDTGTVDGGTAGHLATYVITGVGLLGVVTSYTITFGGLGYSLASAVTTTDAGAQAGSGSGFKIDITALLGENARVTIHVG